LLTAQELDNVQYRLTVRLLLEDASECGAARGCRELTRKP